jgi:hypothetical protein
MIKVYNYLLSLLIVIFFLGCGSDGGGTNNSPDLKIKLLTVATGVSLGNANITIKDLKGQVLLKDAKTDENGSLYTSDDLLLDRKLYVLESTKMLNDTTNEILYAIFSFNMIKNSIKVTPISTIITSLLFPNDKTLKYSFDNLQTTPLEYIVEENLTEALDNTYSLLKNILLIKNVNYTNSSSLISGLHNTDGTGLDAVLETMKFQVEQVDMNGTNKNQIEIYPKSKIANSSYGKLIFDSNLKGLKSILELKSTKDKLDNFTSHLKVENPVIIIFGKTNEWTDSNTSGYNGQVMIFNGGIDHIINWRLDFNSTSLVQNGVWNANRVYDNRTLRANGFSFINIEENKIGYGNNNIVGFGYQGVGDFNNTINNINDMHLNNFPAIVKYHTLSNTLLTTQTNDNMLTTYLAKNYSTTDATRYLNEINAFMNTLGGKSANDITNQNNDLQSLRYNQENIITLKTTNITEDDFEVTIKIPNDGTYVTVDGLRNFVYTDYIKIEFDMPIGMYIEKEQGCFGTAQCSLVMDGRKATLTARPFAEFVNQNNLRFRNYIELKFRAKGILTNDIKYANLYNINNANRVLTNIVYENFITMQDLNNLNNSKLINQIWDTNPNRLPNTTDIIKTNGGTGISNFKNIIVDEEFLTDEIIEHNNGHFTVGYLPSWRIEHTTQEDANNSRLARIPGYDYIIVSFVKPSLRYDSLVKNSGLELNDILKNGLKETIKKLQSRGTKVYLSLGGSTYTDWTEFAAERYITDLNNAPHKYGLKNLMQEYGFDGIDVDYDVVSLPGDLRRIYTYRNAVVSAYQVAQYLDARNDKKIGLSLAGHATGADCTADMGHFEYRLDNKVVSFVECKGKISYWGNSAGRERSLFKTLINDGYDIDNMFEFVSIKSYDGQNYRFDPIEFYKNYRQMYNGPLAIGLQVPAENWEGAELVITNWDAYGCHDTSMVWGNSYKLNIPQQPYSIERFTAFLKDEYQKSIQENNVTQKNGIMIWNVFKNRENFRCNRAVSYKEIILSVNEYLFNSKSGDEPVKINTLQENLSIPKATILNPSIRANIRTIDVHTLPASDQKNDATYDQIEANIVADKLTLLLLRESQKSFRDNNISYTLNGGIPQITSATTVFPPNINRIRRVLNISQWRELFPLRKTHLKGNNSPIEKNYITNEYTYTYYNFLSAAAVFPNFCNEGWYENNNSLIDNNQTLLDQICKKELSTLFSHIVKLSGARDDIYASGKYSQNVFLELELQSNRVFNDYNQTELIIPKWKQGFFTLVEDNCREDSPLGCTYRDCQLFPCNQRAKYFGRGVSKMYYNENYIEFSKKIYGNTNILLNNPDITARDGRVAILTSMYQYMVSKPPKPSSHLIITGGWVPNANDLRNNRVRGFGSTIDALSGDVDCGAEIESKEAQNTINYYKEFRKFFNIPILDLYNNSNSNLGFDNLIDSNSSFDQNKKLGCNEIKSIFAGGYSDINSYWDRHWSEPGRCRLVPYPTKFSALDIGNYKECVKNHFFVN